MASMFYPAALRQILAGEIDLHTGGNDIRVALLMTNTTADTDQDGMDNVADIVTLDECDATGYARVALASEVVTEDTGNNRAEFDAADSSFTSLSGDATRDIQGALVYKHVDGTDANDIPLCFVDFTTDIPSTATQIDIPWNAEGIIQAAQAA
jgi:hypothetical protein